MFCAAPAYPLRFGSARGLFTQPTRVKFRKKLDPAGIGPSDMPDLGAHQTPRPPPNPFPKLPLLEAIQAVKDGMEDQTVPVDAEGTEDDR
jgi:hypothetical protein